MKCEIVSRGDRPCREGLGPPARWPSKGGGEKGRAVAISPEQGTQRPCNRLQVLGARLRVGHPPLQARESRFESEAPNCPKEVGPAPFQRHRSRIRNPGFGP